MGSELDRIHQRLDELMQSFGSLKSTVESNIALCSTCRPKVLGNGKEGFDARLARLEEARAVSKTFLLAMVSLAGAAGAIAGSLPKLLEMAGKLF
jgi:hypothetical protein